MVLWVGGQCMIVVILTYLLDVCGHRELTKVASDMRRDSYSVMPDDKEASTRVSIQKPHQMLGMNGFASVVRTQMCVY